MRFGGKERLADADLEAAAKTIRESLEAEIREHELPRVDQGLNQSSKSGERRYIENLISPPPTFSGREQLARALVDRGFRLGQLGRGEEEISVYDDALTRFGAAPEPALREQVVKKIEHP